MAITKKYTLSALRPVHSPDLARTRPVRLPVGGPVGVGGKYAAGQVLGAVTTAAAADEVRTLTVSGSPTTMTGYFTYTADKAYVTAASPNGSGLPTAAQMQAMLEEVFDKGNVTVALAGAVYTITFVNLCGKVRVGGKLEFTPTFTGGTTPAVAFATTTQGTCGVGQFDRYDDSKSDGTQVARAILERDYLSDPQGGRVTEHGPTNQPESPDAFVSGFFRVGDLTGLDAAAVADPGWRLAEGTSPTNAEGVVRLS